MVSAQSAEVGGPTRRRPPLPVKLVIAGGFGVGKTTTVGSISEISPLTTEADMTSAAAGIDDASKVPGKRTTTVAMDFGCITIDESLKLYLFGTPGQDRFWFMWDDLVRGAIGAPHYPCLCFFFAGRTVIVPVPPPALPARSRAVTCTS